MIDGKLTPEEIALKDSWNDHGSDVTEATILKSLMPWFTNAGNLLRSGFALQSLDAMVPKYTDRESIVLLGSGPSVSEIVTSLPRDPKTLLVCGPTAVATLLTCGRSPDIVMVADSAPEQYTVIRDLDPDDIAFWRFVLPVTADPSWYSHGTILRPDQIYFYLPYLKDRDGTDNNFNKILKALFPDIHLYIAQAGSVFNAMLGLSEALCKDSSSKRVYLGADCCGWLTDPPRLRSYDAEKQEDGTYRPILSPRQVNQNRIESEGSMRIPSPGFDLQTNLVSLAYAIQMLYMVHIATRTQATEHRYVMLTESLRLFQAAAPLEACPTCRAQDVGKTFNSELLSSPEWQYNVMLGLMRLSKDLRDRLDALEAEATGAIRARLLEIGFHPEDANWQLETLNLSRKYDVSLESIHGVARELALAFPKEENPL